MGAFSGSHFDEDRRIMADINDYVKNYSDLTFEEYKQLKYGK
jgi:hypothetical protein